MASTAPLQKIKGYELRHQIGAGGFGAVYRAFQPVVERDVAMKVILPEYANQPAFIRNFESEARLVARLEHPHIVPLFDFWRDPNGAYIVMRWIKGGSLRDKMDDGGVPMDLDAVGRILDQVTSALSTAHRSQVIHRDIKPENILLDEDGNAYVTDFGIARQMGTDPDTEDDHDSISGSILYMPPETIQSQTPSPQSDMYSLGIMLYELVTGQYPFAYESPTQVIMKHLMDELPSVIDVIDTLPEDVDEIIRRATAKQPDERYDDIRQMAIDFRRMLNQGGSAIPLDFSYDDLQNPYKGLRAFDEADSVDFFGREALINELSEALAASDFLAVVGPSGSGKSSVVRAGLVPRLRRDGLEGYDQWFIADMMPGTEPIQALEAALQGVAAIDTRDLSDRLANTPNGLLWAAEQILTAPEDRLLLVIDQFEEVFTLVTDEAKREHFMRLIRYAVTEGESRQLRVVITLRADFYDRPLYYESFGALMRTNTHVVLPMSAAEIERAIAGPAERVFMEVNADLIAAIVADVQEEPGALPLLQYALTEVFERRDENRLTLQAYQEIGGVTGALARRADEVYAELDADEQAAARQVFMRLVTLGEGTEDTRRRVAQSELVALISKRYALHAVLDGFGRYRLLTFDTDPETRQPVVEVAHEAIIREWSLLRTWLSESRNDIHLQRVLAGMTEAWQENNRDESYLLRGSRLAQYEEWIEGTEIALSSDEREFLKISTNARLRAERQRRRIQAVIAGVGIAALIILSALTIFAMGQSRIAREEAFERATAQANSQIARETSDANAVFAATSAASARDEADRSLVLLLASEAQQLLDRGNPATALSLALEAHEIGAAPSNSRRILASTAYTPGARKQFKPHEGEIRTITFSPDGQFAVTGGADARVLMLNPDTGEVIKTFEGHFSPVNMVQFNDSGTQLVTSDEGGVILLWNVETAEIIGRFEGHTRSVTDVDFGPFDASIVSSSDDGTVILWDTFSGEQVRQFEGHEGTIWTVDFSGDGGTIITGGEDRKAILWSAASGTPILELDAHNGPVFDVQLSPDGTQILTGSVDNTAILWDAFTGDLIQLFAGHTGPVTSVAFSDDADRLLSGSQDGLVIVWSIETRREVRRYRGHEAAVNGISFRPNTTQVASVSSDWSMIVWDTLPGAQIRNISTDTVNLFSMAYSPDGRTAITSSDFHRLIQYDVQSDRILQYLDGHTDIVWTIDYNADATRAVSGSNNGQIIVWDLETGEMLRQMDDHNTGGVWAVAFSPDGKTVLSGSDEMAFILWDVETGQEIRRFGADMYTARVRSVAYSPDGNRVLGGSDSAQLFLFDIETGDLLQEYPGHSASVRSIAFFPDGSKIISGSDDTDIYVWDTLSGQRLTEFTEHQNWVTSVDVHPDATLAVSASEDETVIIWDLTASEELWRLEDFEGGIWRVYFGPDGDTLLTASGSGMGRADVGDFLKLWRVQTFEDLLAWVQDNRVVREISCEELQLFGLPVSCEVE